MNSCAFIQYVIVLYTEPQWFYGLCLPGHAVVIGYLPRRCELALSSAQFKPKRARKPG